MHLLPKRLGFERAAGRSTQPAAEIAETAKSFGQSADRCTLNCFTSLIIASVPAMIVNQDSW